MEISSNFYVNTIKEIFCNNKQFYIGVASGFKIENYKNIPNEPNDPSYKRQLITFKQFESYRVGNENLIVFPTSSTNWGNITDYVIFDGESGGNWLIFSSLPQILKTSTNTAICFPVDSIRIRINSSDGYYVEK